MQLEELTIRYKGTKKKKQVKGTLTSRLITSRGRAKPETKHSQDFILPTFPRRIGAWKIWVDCHCVNSLSEGQKMLNDYRLTPSWTEYYDATLALILWYVKRSILSVWVFTTKFDGCFTRLGSIACVGATSEASFESRTERFASVGSFFKKICTIVAEYTFDLTKKERAMGERNNWGRLPRTRK